MPALPPVRAFRVRVTGTNDDTTWGFRLFFSYTGTALTHSDVEAIVHHTASYLTESFEAEPNWWNSNTIARNVIVTDLSSNMGHEEEETIAATGHREGTPVSSFLAAHVEFEIGRRYRGGHPGCYLPGGVEADIEGAARWLETAYEAARRTVQELVTAIEETPGLSVSGVAQCAISYYHEFTPVTNPITGRTRDVPKLRPEPLVNEVTGMKADARISTQKRRRTSLAP